MNIKEVEGKKLEKAFLEFPRRLYQRDPNYVVPFDSEIRNAFDRDMNSYFRHGDARRWVAMDEKGEIKGRIAAFYDADKYLPGEIRSGGCGYFESVNDLQVSHGLFDTARDWLNEQGYEAMDGPVNFGENDSNWGCLVQGFQPPVLGVTYNFPYYRELFESYGFQLYYRQLSYQLDIAKPFPERFWKIASWINERKGYSFKHFDPKKTASFVDDTVHIYNEAWSKMREDYTPMDPSSLYDELRKIKDIMDPELIWFAYYEGKPIAFFMFLPDANQIFRHLNGKLHLFNKLRFLNYRRKHIIDSMRGTAAGVVPRFQNSGVESGILYQLKQKVENKPWFKKVELSWVGDFNPKMIKLYRETGAQHTKTHITYRYLFDRNRPYERFMPHEVDETILPGNSLHFK